VGVEWAQVWTILVPVLGLMVSGFFFGNRRLDDLRADMNARFATVDVRFSEFRQDLRDLRQEFTGLRQEVQQEIGSVRRDIADLRQDLGDLRALVQEALRARTP
jgi:hypothetical protein